jgi:hypothetical protein
MALDICPTASAFYNDGSPLDSPAFREYNMGCGGSRHMGGALIVQDHPVR